MTIEYDLLGKISQLLIECQVSEIKPNRLIINKAYLDIIQKKFPESIDGNFFLYNNTNRIGIITTEEEYIGVGLAYDEFEIIKYNRSLVN